MNNTMKKAVRIILPFIGIPVYLSGFIPLNFLYYPMQEWVDTLEHDSREEECTALYCHICHGLRGK